MADFQCKTFNVSMPADRQIGFCAIQYRKGRQECLDCERGKSAAAADAKERRAGIQEKPPIGLTREEKERRQEREEEKKMPICKRTCSLCEKEFQGGPTAKTCPECKGTKGSDRKKAGYGGKKPGRTRTAGSAGTPSISAGKRHPDSRVLDALVLLGVVSQYHVDETRKYLGRIAS